MSRLADWMKRTGTTQVRLSTATGIPQPLISKYLLGKQRPHIDNAVAIERATGGDVPVESWAADCDRLDAISPMATPDGDATAVDADATAAAEARATDPAA